MSGDTLYMKDKDDNLQPIGRLVELGASAAIQPESLTEKGTMASAAYTQAHLLERIRSGIIPYVQDHVPIEKDGKMEFKMTIFVIKLSEVK